MFQSDPSSYFFDVNAKATLKPSDQDVLFLSFYWGQDDLDNSRDIQMPNFLNNRPNQMGFSLDISGQYLDITDWGNTGLALNWNRQWSPLFSSHVTFSWSNYYNIRDMESSLQITRISENDEIPIEEPGRNISTYLNEENRIRDLSLKLDNQWDLGDNHKLGFGIQVTANTIGVDYGMANFRPGQTPGGTVDPIMVLDSEKSGSQLSLYLQDKVNIGNLITLTPGIRLTHYTLSNELFTEPRLSLIFNLSKRIKLKGAFGRYVQFANNLIREDIMRGDTEFWALSDGETIPVSSAIHYIAGISYETSGFLFDVEAYYKDLSGISEFSLRFTPTSEIENYTDYFYTGNGMAKGIEFLLQKKFGNWTGWLCYTLGEVTYDFPDFGPNPFPASHDVTHEFKWVNNLKIGKWTFATTWIYATGRPHTEPLSATQEFIYLEDRNREIVINKINYGSKNGSRLPPYHRLDLSVNYYFILNSTQIITGLSIFNLYNRNNIWRYEYDIAENELIRNEITYMNITPSLFLKLTF